jgi:polyferredoxin
LGLLQDLLHRAPQPKWKPAFWLSNTVRIGAFAILLGGLILAGADWIGIIDPFHLFSLTTTLESRVFAAAVLLVSLFVYRPWCQFLCPFGLIGWLVEQVSLMRPRIDRDACKECQLSVQACPTQAMSEHYEGKAIRADCFACGACLQSCASPDALQWRARAQ